MLDWTAIILALIEHFGSGVFVVFILYYGVVKPHNSEHDKHRSVHETFGKTVNDNTDKFNHRLTSLENWKSEIEKSARGY